MKIFVFVAAVLLSLCIAPVDNEAEAGRGRERRIERRTMRRESRMERRETRQEMRMSRRGW